MEAAAVQSNKTRRRADRDRCVLWVRTGRVGHVRTAGVDRVEALDLVAQITYVRGGSAGTWGLRAKGTAARWQAWQRHQGGGGYNIDDDGLL